MSDDAAKWKMLRETVIFCAIIAIATCVIYLPLKLLESWLGTS